MSAAPGPPPAAVPRARARTALADRVGRAARAASARAAGLLQPVLALVFPSACRECDEPLAHPSRGPFCAACWDARPRHRQPLCRCGLPVTPAAGGVCGRCRRGINPIVRGASLGPYEGVLRTAVHELKYRGRRRLAPRLARALADEPAVRPLLAEGALLVPVPLHARRLRARGFNQSALLARGLSARTGLRVAEVLRRRRDTTPQTGLSAARRRANVRAAFVVRRPAWVRGRTVILVDDVQTTGATALSCAHALLGAGAAEVRLVTVARA